MYLSGHIYVLYAHKCKLKRLFGTSNLTVHFHRATLPEINGLLAAPILLCHRHNRLLEVEISVQLYQVFRNPSLTNGPEFEV